MISGKAKKLVPVRERLQALTPAELTEVSGGGHGHGHEHEHEHEHKHRSHRRRKGRGY